MTPQELEQVIRESITDIYKATYIGKLWVHKIKTGGWKVQFGLHTPDFPLTIYADLDDDKFIKFIKDELRSRRLGSIYFSELNKVYPYNTTNHNCNDESRIN